MNQSEAIRMSTRETVGEAVRTAIDVQEVYWGIHMGLVWRVADVVDNQVQEEIGG